MKALSVKLPWAYYIIYGVPFGVVKDNPNGTQRVEDSGKVILKDIENRDWPLPPWFELPQRIYIHVSKKPDDMQAVMEFTIGKIGLPAMPIILSYSTRLPRGAIIGEVDVVECVTESKSPWFAGPYGFILANPVAYETPIPCRGKLGFFDPDIPLTNTTPQPQQVPRESSSKGTE